MEGKHKQNLTLLAALLEIMPQDLFDMADYRPGVEAKDLHACGTVGCALGWMTAIVAPSEDFTVNMKMSWHKYGKETVGLGFNDDAWDFLFAGEWNGVDNTPKGAAARIRYYLDHHDEWANGEYAFLNGGDCPAEEDLDRYSDYIRD